MDFSNANLSQRVGQATTSASIHPYSDANVRSCFTANRRSNTCYPTELIVALTAMAMRTFVDLAPGSVALGWRFDEVLPGNAARAIDEYLDGYNFRSALFSPPRTAAIKPFSLAVEPVPWADLIEDTAFVEAAASLAEVCARIDAQLQSKGLRLPTEDEFEAAIGGGLFAWGDFVPEGIPSGDLTAFTKHKDPTGAGLRLNSDTYSTELVGTYLKLGDGGVSVCGGEPWPMPWLCFSPSFRVPFEMYSDCLQEYLETTLLRPVKIG